jgi:hypothetical protein
LRVSLCFFSAFHCLAQSEALDAVGFVDTGVDEALDATGAGFAAGAAAANAAPPASERTMAEDISILRICGGSPWTAALAGGEGICAVQTGLNLTAASQICQVRRPKVAFRRFR